MSKIAAAKALQEDILNAPLHCFGNHRKCKPEYCKTVRALQSPTNANDSKQSDTPLTSDNGSSNDVSFTLSTSSISTSDSLSQASSSLADYCDETSSDDSFNVLLLEQQLAWEEATSDTLEDAQPVDTLEPTVPLDQQMICDIQKIAARLAAKASQLIGKSLHKTIIITLYHNYN